MGKKAFFIFILLLSKAELSAAPSVTINQYSPEEFKKLGITLQEGIRPNERTLTLLKCIDFPTDQDIAMSQRRMIGATSGYSEVTRFRCLPSGAIFITSKKIEKPALILSSIGTLPGEKVYVRFTGDKGFVHDIAFIQRPLKNKSADQTLTIGAQLLSLQPTSYSVKIQGLQEGEVYLYEVSCGEEKINQRRKYKDKQVILFSPSISGSSGGVAHIRIQTFSGKAVDLEFPWGDRLYEFFDSGNDAGRQNQQETSKQTAS